MQYTLFALALTLVACGDPDDTDNVDIDDAMDTEADTTSDDGTEFDTDTEADTEPDTEPPPANEAAVGDWEMVTSGTSCNFSFAGPWLGEASDSNEFAFTLTYTEEVGRELSCIMRAVDTTEFTCSDVSQSGIVSNCNVSMSATNVSGSIVDGYAELRADMSMSSSNCGQALNCGPTPHISSGTIE